MPTTRRGSAATNKTAQQPSSDHQPEKSVSTSASPSASMGGAGGDDLDESSLQALMMSLGEESKTLVKILTKVITAQFKSEFESLKKEMSSKDTQISDLKSEVHDLRQKVNNLEIELDNADQYERRDTVIINGPLVPPESRLENTVHVVTVAIKDHLRININEKDISVAHRIGPVNSQRPRPIIVKLVNRSLKYDLKRACIELKPQLFINESLTPKRLALYKKVLHIRKIHKAKFQQCHTKDGKIIVKLKNSTVKHVIVDENSLLDFLEKYPLMKETYMEYNTDT